MTDVLTKTDVKISADNLTGSFVYQDVLPGEFFPILKLKKYSAIIIIYQVSGNGYKNSFFIPRELFESVWFTEHNGNNNIHVRISDENINVSPNSTGLLTKVIGYKLIY